MLAAVRRNEAERVEQAERQRDILVREVHHRIKNHLQGVVGLLSERVRTLPTMAPIIEDTVRQIRIIAEVYGLQGASDAMPVTLTSLVTLAARAKMDDKPVEILSSLTDTDGVIGRDEIVPMALVVNELMTDAIKHSDPAHRDRPVTVRLDREDGAACLLIRNGPATLPNDFSLATDDGLGNGLELTRALLPRKLTTLDIWQDGPDVVTKLTLVNSASPTLN